MREAKPSHRPAVCGIYGDIKVVDLSAAADCRLRSARREIPRRVDVDIHRYGVGHSLCDIAHRGFKADANAEAMFLPIWSRKTVDGECMPSTDFIASVTAEPKRLDFSDKPVFHVLDTVPQTFKKFCRSRQKRLTTVYAEKSF